MTKVIKNTIFALFVALFAFLPFMFAGCNEKEIEGYKSQIAELQTQNTQLGQQNSELQAQKAQLETEKTGLQQQNTQLGQQNSELQTQNEELQEQVDTIHTPTAKEREAYNIIRKAIDVLSSDVDVQNMGSNIEKLFCQFWGIELNKVLNLSVTYGDTPTNYNYKIQIIITSNSIQINGSAMNQYAFYTINFNENDNNNLVDIKAEAYVKNGTDDYYAEVRLYTVNTSDFTQNQYTEGEIFEAIKQKAQAYDALETNVDANMIVDSSFVL